MGCAVAKGGAEDYPEGEEKRLEEIVDDSQAERWVCEIDARVKGECEESEEPDFEEAWDDVKEGELDAKEVQAARKEEVSYMEGREFGRRGR